LTANQKYNLLMEYYEASGLASATLGWASAGRSREIIPQTQLYPVMSAVQPTFTLSNDGTQMTISWVGTYTLQSDTDLSTPSWTTVTTTSPSVVTIDPNTPAMFFRLLSQ